MQSPSAPARRVRPILAGWASLLVLAALALAVPGAMGQGVVSLGTGAASGAPGPSASPGPAGSFDPQQALLEVAECMREHGVDMPDPEFTGDGSLRLRLVGMLGRLREDPDFDAAREACSGFLEGQMRAVDPGRLLELQEQLLSYAACMREHGIDMPDPDLTGPGPASLPSWDTTDPAFQAAHEACADLVGGPLPSSEPFEGPRAS